MMKCSELIFNAIEREEKSLSPRTNIILILQSYGALVLSLSYSVCQVETYAVKQAVVSILRFENDEINAMQLEMKVHFNEL